MFFRMCRHFGTDHEFADRIVWRPGCADWALLLCADCGAVVLRAATRANDEAHAKACSMEVFVVCADAAGTLDKIKVAASNGDLGPVTCDDGGVAPAACQC